MGRRTLTSAPPRGNSTAAALEQLTEREVMVAEAVVDGFSDQQIATALGISVNTVRTHMTSIGGKLPGAPAMRPRARIFTTWMSHTTPHEERGWVYFIRGGKACRIGTAIDPYQRFKVHFASSPVRLKLIGFIRGSTEDEAALHERFDHLRMHSEWFRLKGELEEYLTDLFSEPPWGRAL